jgi:hypothetical protein
MAHYLMPMHGRIFGAHAQCHGHPAEILSYEKEILGERNQFRANPEPMVISWHRGKLSRLAHNLSGPPKIHPVGDHWCPSPLAKNIGQTEENIEVSQHHSVDKNHVIG